MRYMPGRCLLRQLLDERRLTQRWLSERTGLSEQKISDYANRRTIMRLDIAKSISEQLKVPIDLLYEWSIVDER